MIDIQKIIEILVGSDHFNTGQNIEIAKGKNEAIHTYKDLKNKIKRSWRSKK